MIISDFAYGEICFDGYRAPSFLAADGAKELGVEFTTMSKSYNMAGWRCGSARAMPRWSKHWPPSKATYDYGMFAPSRSPASSPCPSAPTPPTSRPRIYEERRDEVCRGLDKARLELTKTPSSMFVWAQDQDEHLKGEGTIDFCLRMMDGSRSRLAPGRAFGEHGENFVRIALVENEQRSARAMRNLERALNPRQPKPKRAAATA